MIRTTRKALQKQLAEGAREGPSARIRCASLSPDGGGIGTSARRQKRMSVLAGSLCLRVRAGLGSGLGPLVSYRLPLLAPSTAYGAAACWLLAASLSEE